MGYYASCDGSITVKGTVDDFFGAIGLDADDCWVFDCTDKEYDEVKGETTLQFNYYGKYYSEDVDDFLDRVVDNLEVVSGALYYSGEDGENWRFRYSPNGNVFVEENGTISYLDISAERLLDILRAYVDNDLDSGDPDYVREVLTDVCGMTDFELKATGFDYLFNDEEEEN